MGKERTGSLTWDRKRGWLARISVVGGRPWIQTDPSLPNNERGRARAQEIATERSELAKREGLTIADFGIVRRKPREHAPDPGELVSVWFERYVVLHASLGAHTTQHRGDFRRYVEPFIGSKGIAAVVPADIKRIRDNLTRLRIAGEISAKRAVNVWSDVVRAPLKRAFTDDDPKYDSVRVGPFSANPSNGIKPPATREDLEEDDRERQALEPFEALALLSCSDVPRDDRRFYALLLYTGLRPAEAYGLSWIDVRLDDARPVLKILRSRDMKTGHEEERTKTRAGVRDVPIHPRIRPMLRAMRDAAGGVRATGRVFPVDRVRDVEGRVAELRGHLMLASISRPEIHDGTATLVPFDVRSFRTTFTTWATTAGYDSRWVDAWIGHKPKDTAARHYVKAVPHFEDVLLKPPPAGTVAPFPEVPTELETVSNDRPDDHDPRPSGGNRRGRRGSQSRRSPANTARSLASASVSSPFLRTSNDSESLEFQNLDDSPDNSPGPETESVDVAELLGPANVPSPLLEPLPRDDAGRESWTRLGHLLAAVESLIAAGAVGHARAVVAEARALAEAEAPRTADVISMRSRRT